MPPSYERPPLSRLDELFHMVEEPFYIRIIVCDKRHVNLGVLKS